MVSDKEHGPVFIRDDLAPHDGLKTFLFGRFDKGDQAVKAVGVGEGEAVHALLCSGLTELFKGGHPPSGGVVGVDVEMNKRHYFTTETQRAQRGVFFRLSGDTDRRKWTLWQIRHESSQIACELGFQDRTFSFAGISRQMKMLFSVSSEPLW